MTSTLNAKTSQSPYKRIMLRKYVAGDLVALLNMWDELVYYDMSFHTVIICSSTIQLNLLSRYN